MIHAAAVPLPIQWMTAVAQLLGAIAWPAIILAVLLIFRAQIIDALRRATHAKVGPVELDMQEKTESEIAEAITDETATPGPERRARPLLGIVFFQASVENPLNAILEGYLAIERRLDDVLKEHSLSNHDGITKLGVDDMAAVAREQGLVSDRVVDTLAALGALRAGYIGGDKSADIEDARTFLTLCDGLLQIMDGDVDAYDRANPGASAAS